MNRNSWPLICLIAIGGILSCDQSPSTSTTITKTANKAGSLDYTRLGDENPCDFFNIKSIIANHDIQGKVTYKLNPGNSAILPLCEAHWQIGKDSVRIIRTYVFQNKLSEKNLKIMEKNCKGLTDLHVKIKNPKDCAAYGKHNWNSLEYFPANSNYIRVEFEYENEDPISSEEHEIRKSIAIEIAETIVEKLRS